MLDREIKLIFYLWLLRYLSKILIFNQYINSYNHNNNENDDNDYEGNNTNSNNNKLMLGILYTCFKCSNPLSLFLEPLS